VHTESIVREDERDPETARKIARRVVPQDHPFRARRLERAVDRETALWLYLREDDYPGFVVREDRKRVITPGAPYHLVGRVGELSSERVAAAFRASSDAEVVDDARRRDLAWMQHVTSLQPGVAIGASGLERALDETLRCSDGSIRILRDFEGRPAEVLEQTDPADGCDVTLTIDLDLQNAVEEVLVESFGSSGAGSAILMHVETGEILAAAGHPAPRWDETPAELAARRDDPLRSLLPRPFRETAYPYPGSTFKIVPAVAALERGLVDARSTYPCHGFMHRPIDFRCMGYHGDIALESSMERSCNVFYYYLGEELGGTELAEWSRRFGFGRPTGVEFFDGAGHVFDPDSKRPWVRGDARKLAIGQVNVEVTPLQVLRSVLAIGTGGVLVRPRLVASGAADDTWSRGRTERLEIGAATLDLVRRSLVGVVRDPRGTAVGHGLEAFDAAGKTGTAQTGIEDEEHAWFAGYAPSHDPEIGIVVVRERTELHGGEGAGPVAAAILGEYFARYGSER